MKKLVSCTIAAALALGASSASAQTFVYEVSWEPLEGVGGMMGPNGYQGYGGTIKGTYTTNYSDGSESSGTVKCVGLRQPDGGIFAIHMSCSIDDTNGKSSAVYGCNYLGEEGSDTALGCVGGLQGRDGDIEGMNGSLTMHWYAEDKAIGTGQWYTSQAAE